MTLQSVKKEAKTLFNDLVKMGVHTSYRSVLNSMYESASEKGLYEKAHFINQLIVEDINE